MTALGGEPDVDELMQHWLEMEGAKACPDCGIWITKHGGCPHMTCEMCSFEFCWFCLIPYDECNEEHDEEEEGGDY